MSWPNQPITTAEQFARHWLNQVESFADWRDPAVFFFRYEDLIRHRNAIRGVQAHAQLDTIDASVIQQVVGNRAEKAPLNDQDIQIIESIAGEAARSIGYTPAGGLLAAA